MTALFLFSAERTTIGPTSKYTNIALCASLLTFRCFLHYPFLYVRQCLMNNYMYLSLYIYACVSWSCGYPCNLLCLFVLAHYSVTSHIGVSWQEIAGCAFSPNGRFLAVGSRDNRVVLLEISDGSYSLADTLEGFSNCVCHIVTYITNAFQHISFYLI